MGSFLYVYVLIRDMSTCKMRTTKNNSKTVKFGSVIIWCNGNAMFMGADQGGRATTCLLRRVLLGRVLEIAFEKVLRRFP